MIRLSCCKDKVAKKYFQIRNMIRCKATISVTWMGFQEFHHLIVSENSLVHSSAPKAFFYDLSRIYDNLFYEADWQLSAVNHSRAKLYHNYLLRFSKDSTLNPNHYDKKEFTLALNIFNNSCFTVMESFKREWCWIITLAGRWYLKKVFLLTQ